MPNCVKCHQPQTAAPVICSECYEKLTAELAEKDKQLAALTAALIDCGYDDGSICNYCANDGACDIETNEYVQKKGTCFVFRGPQEAGEGGG